STDNEEFGGVTHTLTHKHMWSVKRIQTATWAVTLVYAFMLRMKLLDFPLPVRASNEWNHRTASR
ncbi:hypothetical protein, partial [Bradyrhizobium sp. 197]|uniref:hypothetical protein n=1 Tax=Bradyrhizobium sp. 197 TaxID=2782663 RepID=UPI001FF9CC79